MEGKEHGIILLNKLQLPEIKTKTLRRRRLLNFIAKNLDKKVILLCAGAGYGKTTLLSHLLSEKRIRIVYYHLERKDAEPVVFFSYLIAGIRRINPSFGHKLEGLRHLFNHPQRSLEIIAGTSLNEIVENIRDDIYIILEDYHALHPSVSIDKMLDYIFNHMPANLHFIITSRSNPEVSFLQMITRDEFLELGADELRFTKEEIRRLFEKTYSMSLKRKDLEWVEKYSEGWPVSLRLMLQSTNYLEGIRASDHTRMVISNFLQSQASLFNYFAQEIFFQETPRMRDFLLDCSVFEWLSPGLCDAVTGRKNTARLLSDLTKRNAFIVRIPEHGYRLHNLFRDFLYSKLTDERRRKQLYLRAGNYFATKRKYDEAFGFFLHAKAYKKMVHIVRKIGSKFIGQGRSAMLCNYVEQIPRAIVNRNPDLLITFSQALSLVGRLEDARRNCVKARRILQKSIKTKGRYADMLYVLGGIHNTLGKRATAMRYFRNALAVCPRTAHLTRAAILNSLGSLHNMIGGKHLSIAIGYFQKALGIAQKSHYKEIEASILNNWAWGEWKMGNLNEAYAKLTEAIPILERNFSPGCGAGFYNAAQYSLLLGYNKQSKAILDLGVQTCGPYNDIWSLATIWKGYATFFRKTGDLKKAAQYASKALQSYEKLGVDRLIVAALTEICEINIANRDYASAEKHVSSIWLHKKVRDDADAIPIHLTVSRLKSAQGKIQQAEEMLIIALQLAEKFGEILQRFLAYMELTKLLYKKMDRNESYKVLRKAIEISNLKGYDHLLVEYLQRETWMLQAIREMDIRRNYVVGIIKKSKLDIHWIDGFLFGVPKVTVDDHLITEGAWRTVKAKKLFFYLLLHRKERVSSDMLVDALWPDVSRRKGGDSLRKAMQHIREIMGSELGATAELVNSVKGVYEISPSISIWLDVNEFDSLHNRALKSLDDVEKETALQRAMDLYKDGFAVGWYDRWVDDLRRYYQGRYEECLAGLASMYCRKGRYNESAGLSEKLLSVNFLDECYHRQYMETLGRLGRYRDIEGNFEKLKKTLEQELKAEPQRKTIELYKSLIKANTAH
jgi:ATP/maltotriose-dependent transcriptional regulator MalT/DNA-binding SARP family transcriptional activator